MRQNLSKQQPAAPGDGAICHSTPFNFSWRLHAADAAFRSFPMLYFNVCSVPETDIKSIASVNLSGKGILSLIAFLVQSEVLHPFLNNLK